MIRDVANKAAELIPEANLGEKGKSFVYIHDADNRNSALVEVNWYGLQGSEGESDK